MDDRLAALEGQWVFLAGFGMPLALLSVSFPTFVSYGVVAFVFPLFVVLATTSEPRVHAPSTWLPRRLPLFALSKRLSLWLVRRLDRRVKRPATLGAGGGSRGRACASGGAGGTRGPGSAPSAAATAAAAAAVRSAAATPAHHRASQGKTTDGITRVKGKSD
mmetsp:Transcript_11377/g.29581  ORF Transcript_11377/g.29581 Transcript_11377/m.29581 type:complete len:162 (+) Transcript_11377:277-762(+)